MKKRIQLTVFSFLLLAIHCGCSNTVKIKNVSFSETVTLNSNTDTPHSIWLMFKGQIEGEAKISLMMEGKPYRTKELNGDIDFEWKSDWYYPSAILKYDHGNTKSGNLTIKYDF